MKNINVKNIKIVIASIILVYLLISLYFMNHFFFNTVINGVDVSLKAHDAVNSIFTSYVRDYRLQIIERSGDTEAITAQEIEMQYNEKNSISKVQLAQISFKWPVSLIREQNYFVKDLYVYDKEKFEDRISELNCLYREIIEPRNVSFRYENGYYEVVEEVYGNKLYKDRLYVVIASNVLKGHTKLDLNKSLCYQDPRYTRNSDKTSQTKKLLDRYVSAKITYILRNDNAVLDHNTINQWLSVDEDLDVVINEEAVRQYVQELSKKYDTVGTARRFKTALGKKVEVKGGFYGWKINRAAETQALIVNIKRSEVIEREPIYIQRGISGVENDIGDSYVEINLTRQHLWFFKKGRLVAQGPVVTGNPNRGNATETGVYMLNYKQKGPTLRGPGYEAEVTYWMPFNGNIGIHDASWRYSYGGNIYRRNGTHGCVNVPKYLAKRIFENIEEGTPVICYEE